MIVAVDLGQLAELARAEVHLHPPRTPGRRAAAALYVAITTTKTLDSARTALAGFAAPDVQADAIELLHRLAASQATATQGGRS